MGFSVCLDTCPPVQHLYVHCRYIFWSTGIIYYVGTIVSRVPLICYGASVLWHISLTLMNSFNKTTTSVLLKLFIHGKKKPLHLRPLAHGRDYFLKFENTITSMIPFDQNKLHNDVVWVKFNSRRTIVCVKSFNYVGLKFRNLTTLDIRHFSGHLNSWI